MSCQFDIDCCEFGEEYIYRKGTTYYLEGNMGNEFEIRFCPMCGYDFMAQVGKTR